MPMPSSSVVKSPSPKARAETAPKNTIRPLPITKPSPQAITASRPRFAKRVQFAACVPAEAKVPTTVVTAAAQVMEVVGAMSNRPRQPPTSPSARAVIQKASTRISGVEISETQYMPS